MLQLINMKTKIKEKENTKKTNKRSKDSNETMENLDHILSAILAIVVFLIAIILLFGSIQMAGNFGNALFTSSYKYLGLWSYIITIPLFYISYFIWGDKEIKYNIKKIIGTLAVIVGLSNIFAIIDSYNNSQMAGIIFLKLERIFVSQFGSIPLIILSIALVYIGYILLMNRRNIIDKEIIEERIAHIKDIWTIWINGFNKNNKKTVAKVEEEETQEEEEMEEEKEMNTPTLHQEVFKQLKREEPAEIIEMEKEIIENKKTKPVKHIDTDFVMPPFDILAEDGAKGTGGDTKAKGMDLQRTLNEFGIAVEMYGTKVGPSVTRYTMKPAQGVNVRKILGLKDNLQMAVSATNMHIEAPIPGQPYVGIEIPNEKKQQLGLRSIIDNEDFINSGKLNVAIGRDIVGNAVYGNIEDMPHLLIAGATKSGKSVTVQNLIVSLLYKNSPDDLKILVIDPKRVEFTIYKNLPHLGTPVITDAKNAVKALNWAIGEMERRYEYFAENHSGIQNLSDYISKIYKPALEKAKKKASDKSIDINDIPLPESIPYIVIIFDEFNDFMLSYPKEITAAITSLTQKGRAAGIHLILATQRPDVKVITGTIKANIPARIALKTSSSIDSRTILDQIGAEDLLGKGDMLYTDSNHPRPIRLQAPYISTEEVKEVMDFIKSHYYNYDAPAIDISKEKVETKIFGAGPSTSDSNSNNGDGENEPVDDEEYNKAKEYVIATGRASTSSLQARFGWGYPKAQKFIIMMERYGIVSTLNGNKREILVGTAQLEREADELLEESEEIE